MIIVKTSITEEILIIVIFEEKSKVFLGQAHKESTHNYREENTFKNSGKASGN